MRITILGYGERTRDFIHVNDVVAADAFAADYLRKITGVYNVGYGGGDPN